MGLSAVADSDELRVNFPDLTEDRRNSMIKIVNEKLESAKVSLRAEREKAMHGITQQQKSKELSDDDDKRDKNQVQKLIDEANKELEESSKRKEKELGE